VRPSWRANAASVGTSSPRNALASSDCVNRSTWTWACFNRASIWSANAKSFSTRRTISCCSARGGKERCDLRGLDPYTTRVLNGAIAATAVTDVYRLTTYEQAVEAELTCDTFSTFSRVHLEQARERFQQLDDQLLQVNRALIAWQVCQRVPPAGISTGRVANFTEMGLIHHELSKQRQQCRPRKLLLRAGTALQTLMPCFMMSPLAVSQFLDPVGVQFDLVIMDEASQIKPEDALGILLRAKQVVVVGDPKQLPPSAYFERLGQEVDEREATQFDNTESILEVATKTFPPARRLKWHYRSRHESLIQFSNERFYDGQLVVIPSATPTHPELGLRRHFVESGRWENGGNFIEAAAVARAIVQHAQRFPDDSLGVGAFNLSQSLLIQEAVDRLCADDIAARTAVEGLSAQSEKMFIKNLENLQGDERDVIFVSYTYGRGPGEQRVQNRFGPLTTALGWRRLNVLITRARKRVEVFTSMTPADILVGPAKSSGVLAMRDYLAFCGNGSSANGREMDTTELNSPFEQAVSTIVRELGLEPVPRCGVAGCFVDLAVVGLVAAILSWALNTIATTTGPQRPSGTGTASVTNC